MNTEEIKAINASGGFDTWEQGIFVQPNHIPTNIKEPVVYMRWNDHGVGGGSCWSESDDDLYDYEGDRPEFTVFKKVCKHVYPEITNEQIRYLEGHLIEEDGETNGFDYYGNYTHYKVEWIELETLERLAEECKKIKF